MLLQNVFQSVLCNIFPLLKERRKSARVVNLTNFIEVKNSAWCCHIRKHRLTIQ